MTCCSCRSGRRTSYHLDSAVSTCWVRPKKKKNKKKQKKKKRQKNKQTKKRRRRSRRRREDDDEDEQNEKYYTINMHILWLVCIFYDYVHSNSVMTLAYTHTYITSSLSHSHSGPYSTKAHLAKMDHGVNSHIMPINGPVGYFVRESCIHSVLNFNGPTFTLAWEDRFHDIIGGAGSLSMAEKWTAFNIRERWAAISI
jgi:hypothetical protein